MAWNFSSSISRIKDFTKEVLHEEVQNVQSDEKVGELKALINHLKTQLFTKENYLKKINRLLAVQNYETFRQRQMNIQLIHLMQLNEERRWSGDVMEPEVFTLRNKLLKILETSLSAVSDDSSQLEVTTGLEAHIVELQSKVDHLTKLNLDLTKKSEADDNKKVPDEQLSKNESSGQLEAKKEKLVQSLQMLREMERQELANIKVQVADGQMGQLQEEVESLDQQRLAGIHTLEELQLKLVGTDQLQNHHKLEEERYKRHINRLQQHIIEIEEMYSAELQEVKKREEELQNKLSIFEKLAQRNDTQNEVETIRFQLRKALADCEKANGRADRAEHWANSLTSDIQNLEGVLQAFTKEGEERTGEINKVKKLLEESERRNTIKDSTIEQLRQAVENKDRIVQDLHQQQEELKQEQNKLLADLDRLKNDVGKTVDKELIKNLFMGYLHTPESSKSTSMVVLAKALDFTQEEIEQYSATDHSLLGSLLGKGDTARPKGGSISKTPPGTPQKVMSAPLPPVGSPDETKHSEMSFVQQFMSFLRHESAPDNETKVPVTSLLNPAPEPVYGMTPPSVPEGNLRSANPRGHMTPSGQKESPPKSGSFQRDNQQPLMGHLSISPIAPNNSSFQPTLSHPNFGQVSLLSYGSQTGNQKESPFDSNTFGQSKSAKSVPPLQFGYLGNTEMKSGGGTNQSAPSISSKENFVNPLAGLSTSIQYTQVMPVAPLQTTSKGSRIV